MQGLKNTFMVTLVNMLSGSRVSSATVLQALELFCKEFLFEYGLIYEVDYSNEFCLMEHYAAHPAELRKRFPAAELTQQERMLMAEQEIAYIAHGHKNTPLQQKLLKLHGAQSMVMAPILDDEQSVFGLVVLLNKTPGALPAEQRLGEISVLLPLLLHYVSGRMYQRRIRQGQTALGNVLDNTGIDIYVNDFYNHDILYVNKSMAAPYGGQEAFKNRKCWQVLFPGQTGPCEFCPQKMLIDDDGEPTKVYSWDYERAFDGSWFRVFSAAFYWADGRLAHVVSSANITDNKRNEAIIENLANYDQLTNLPNRRMLLKEFERRIDNATAVERAYLLFFDIDGFKMINDSLGHDAGDDFLIQLGEFFSSIPLLKNSIYRNGGDEFVAILGGVAISRENVQNLAYFIHERFKKPWILKKGEVFCNTSIGVACFPEDGATAEELLQKADMAMYQVKKTGGGGLCFGSQLEARGLAGASSLK